MKLQFKIIMMLRNFILFPCEHFLVSLTTQIALHPMSHLPLYTLWQRLPCLSSVKLISNHSGTLTYWWRSTVSWWMWGPVSCSRQDHNVVLVFFQAAGTTSLLIRGHLSYPQPQPPPVFFQLFKSYTLITHWFRLPFFKCSFLKWTDTSFTFKVTAYSR